MCCLLLDGSGDRRVVLLLETHVSGRKVDRRVLATDVDEELELITFCLGSDRPDGQGTSLVLFQSVESVRQ